jgi:hypothetical protein
MDIVDKLRVISAQFASENYKYIDEAAETIQSLRNQLALAKEQLAGCQKDAERIELLEETLDKVNNWCKAYPIEICDEPNFEEVK